MLGKTLVFSDFLNLFLFNAKNQIGAVVKAMQARGCSRAWPSRTWSRSTARKRASWPAASSRIRCRQGNFGAVHDHFKEFGVRLSFTPTVLGGDLINLKIRPEVSSLDFNNAVVLEGFRIPALSSRRTETEVELRDGQTFAIAGLMNNTALSSIAQDPGIGDIPILGSLFKSRAYQKDQTELVVMITPHIVRRGSAGVSEGLPSLVEPYLERAQQDAAEPDAYVGSPRYPANRPAPTAAPAPAPAANQPQPSAPVSGQQPAPRQDAPRRSRSPARRRRARRREVAPAAARDSGERRAAGRRRSPADAGAAGSAGGRSSR